jgi:hypothetical protein
MFGILTCLFWFLIITLTFVKIKLFVSFNRAGKTQRACEEELQGCRLYSLEQLFSFNVVLLGSIKKEGRESEGLLYFHDEVIQF